MRTLSWHTDLSYPSYTVPAFIHVKLESTRELRYAHMTSHVRSDIAVFSGATSGEIIPYMPIPEQDDLEPFTCYFQC